MGKMYDNKKEIGNLGEARTIEFIESVEHKFYAQISDKENFPDFDILLLDKSSKLHRIEVKTDTKSNLSVAIECEQSGKTSGIDTSTSNLYFVYKSTSKKLYWIYTSDLRKYLEDSYITPIPCVGGKTYCYIVELDDAGFKEIKSDF